MEGDAEEDRRQSQLAKPYGDGEAELEEQYAPRDEACSRWERSDPGPTEGLIRSGDSEGGVIERMRAGVLGQRRCRIRQQQLE